MMAPTCILCSEPIESLDTVRIHPGWAHRECGIRSALGGIGHHEDHSYWCRNVGDPDGGRTYHQSALEVAALWERGEINPEGQFDG
jgi:hypothetical protein